MRKKKKKKENKETSIQRCCKPKKERSFRKTTVCQIKLLLVKRALRYVETHKKQLLLVVIKAQPLASFATYATLTLWYKFHRARSQKERLQNTNG